MALTPNVPDAKRFRACSKLQFELHVHRPSRAQRFSFLPLLFFLSWVSLVIILCWLNDHRIGNHLIVSVAGLKHEFAQCRGHPVLINVDSVRHSGLSTMNLRSNLILSLKNSSFPFLGDGLSLRTANEVGNRISQLSFFTSALSLKGG